MKIQFLWIEIDSNSVIKIMFGSNSDKWNLRNLIQNIKKFIEQLTLKVTHVYHKGNKTIDYLANWVNKSASTGVRIDGHDFNIFKGFYRTISIPQLWLWKEWFDIWYISSFRILMCELYFVIVVLLCFLVIIFYICFYY